MVYRNRDMMERIQFWLTAHQAWLWWSGAVSVVVVLASMVVIPLLVVRIPADYFNDPSGAKQTSPPRHPVLRGGILLIKNAVGVLLMAAGLALLVLPGQGLLTLLIGFMTLDFPGKFALERRLIRFPLILRAINGLRGRLHREPLRFSAHVDSSAATGRPPADGQGPENGPDCSSRQTGPDR